MLILCEICKGTGFVPCPNCSEKALKDSDLSSDNTNLSCDLSHLANNPEKDCEITDSCSECEGNRKIRCLGCLGTGYVDMPIFA